MRISEARYDRDLRRRELAWRLIRHEARTRTIEHWTGLSEYRIRTLYRAYAADAGRLTSARHRGEPPRQLGFFWDNAILQSEGALLGAFFRVFRLLPEQPLSDAAQVLPSVGRGEWLCTVYEQFRVFRPGSLITVEHAILLLIELARAAEIRLASCERCAIVTLHDRLAVGGVLCPECVSEIGTRLRPFVPLTTGGPVDDKPAPPSESQGSLF